MIWWLWQCGWLPRCSSSTDRPLICSTMAKLNKPRTEILPEMPVISHFEWQFALSHFRWFNVAQLCKQIDLTRVNARRKWHDTYHTPSWSGPLQSRMRTSACQHNTIKNLGCTMRQHQVNARRKTTLEGMFDSFSLNLFALVPYSDNHLSPISCFLKAFLYFCLLYCCNVFCSFVALFCTYWQGGLDVP